eukprot:6759424-Ditylum_brightwellii.AAC.1
MMRLVMRTKTILTLMTELLQICFGLDIPMTDNLVRKRARTLCHLFSKYMINNKNDEAVDKDNKADNKDKNKDNADIGD